MMLHARGVNNLDGLLTLVEYVKDAKNLVKGLKELRDARDDAIEARKAVEKAHGGAAVLTKAAETLSKAQITASDVLAKAEVTANQLIADANAQVGDLVSARTELDALSDKLNGDRISFDETSAETIKELARREQRATKKEDDNARNREELAQERLKMQEKSQRVINAMKG